VIHVSTVVANMPPVVPRKRRKSASPDATLGSSVKRQALAPKKSDQSVGKTKSPSKRRIPTAAENKKYLEILEDDDSSSSNSDEEDFEDVLPASSVKDVDAGESDDDAIWEEVIRPDGPEIEKESLDLKDLELTITQPDDIPVPTKLRGAGNKKGPTKRERLIRKLTHSMHVLCLLWMNTIRNSWLNDKQLHTILLDGLSEGLKREIDHWRTVSGLNVQTKHSSKSLNGKGKKSTKSIRSRDWPADASRLEEGVPDTSRGDPLLKLLRHVVSYWKKRFVVTNPALRKQGYRSVKDYQAQIRAFQGGDRSDARLFGERIADLEEFRSIAKQCQGSSDVGAHLFTALLRAIGIETRMVASLQPAGFGWSQAEEANQMLNPDVFKIAARVGTAVEPIELSGDEEKPPATSTLRYIQSEKVEQEKVSQKRDGSRMTKTNPPLAIPESSRLSRRQNKSHPRMPSGSSSELGDVNSSDLDSDLDLAGLEDTRPVSNSSTKSEYVLPFPTYWSEVLSPITNTFTPVSIFSTPNIASKPEFLGAFEPRGAAADKAKQVICYVVAYSQDGTAKDVTVRYLKRHQLPGKTKGVRLPPEKVPIYNKNGKVIKQIELDWFSNIMTYYARPPHNRTVADDIEDQGDLIALTTTKSTSEESVPETLQGYKSSHEFVLERHLRREEAIMPEAKAVRYFFTGKGDKGKKEPVFLRKDVVNCKTAESWHKEGREIRVGEQAMKMVPIRAATLRRKIEVEEATRYTGEKPVQGLYSREQTDWIIPPPIQDGKIPKNNFGNIDVYVPSMVPQGAVHIPYRGLVRVCKKLEIDYAEACTGFEFGHQMAVPVFTGVVVAEENEELVVDAWKEEEARKRQKEEEGSRNEALTLWRKLSNGLRIIQRVQKEYGNLNPTEFNISTEEPQSYKPSSPVRNSHTEAVRDFRDAEIFEDHESHPEPTRGAFISTGMTVEEPHSSRAQPTKDQVHLDSQDTLQNITNGRMKAQPRSLRSTVPERSDSQLGKSSNSTNKRRRKTKGKSKAPVVMHSQDESNVEESDDIEPDDSNQEEYAAFQTPKRKSTGRGRLCEHRHKKSIL
jgi:xeroderma pigmentosum group C-complementing protein